MNSLRKQRCASKRMDGVGLVELMISVTLGLFLTLGMVQVYLANQVTARLAEASTRMQENGRTALELLAAAVRGSDYWGCLSLSDAKPTPPTNDATLIAFLAEPGVGVQRITTDTGSARVGSHVLTLRGLEELGTVVSGATVVRASCQTRALRRTTDLTGNDPSYAMSTRRFEVRHSTPPDQATRKSLVFIDGTQEYELVEGITDMRFQLGSSASPSNWVDAGSATAQQLNAATALRISVLVESPLDNMRASQQSLCFPAWASCGTTLNWTAPDLRQYAVYTTTVGIRSRING